MLWIFESKLLSDFFTDEEKINVLKKEIMPLMMAYHVVLKKRQFIDFKSAKLTFNTVKSK